MNTSTKFSASQKGQVLLIVLLIAAAIGGYLIYSGKINLNKTSTPVQTTQLISVDETANWKTYEDTKRHVTFKYPTKWLVTCCVDNETVQFHFTENNKSYLMQLNSYRPNGPIVDKVVDDNVSIDNIKFYKKTWIKNNQPVSISLVRAIGGSSENVWNIIMDFPADNNAKYVTYFDQILSTFKFTN